MKEKFNVNINIEEASKGLKNIQNQMNNILKNFEKVLEPIKNLSLEFEKIIKNPESYLNYISYMKELEKYYWAMPYKIKASTLKEIIEKVGNEKEFDEFMFEYFSDEKINEMLYEIEAKISQEKKIVFKQIMSNFHLENFAIINNSVISIIDDELSKYTKNKKDTSRKNLFLPIYEDLDEKEKISINDIYLRILNNNINKLFENINFNNIKINTKKEIRRHILQHGKKYSNEKIDSIMLLNTLYGLLAIENYLEKYKNKLIFINNKRGFEYILKNK